MKKYIMTTKNSNTPMPESGEAVSGATGVPAEELTTAALETGATGGSA
jgi:hypothetical protein